MHACAGVCTTPVQTLRAFSSAGVQGGFLRDVAEPLSSSACHPGSSWKRQGLSLRARCSFEDGNTLIFSHPPLPSGSRCPQGQAGVGEAWRDGLRPGPCQPVTTLLISPALPFLLSHAGLQAGPREVGPCVQTHTATRGQGQELGLLTSENSSWAGSI